MYNNPLTESPNDYSARVSSAGSLTLDDVVDAVVSKRSEYQAETIRSIGSQIFSTMGDKLMEGYSVNTPLFRASAAVSGAFMGKTAGFKKDEHKL